LVPPPGCGFGARHHLVQCLDQARRLRGARERRSDEEVEREFRVFWKIVGEEGRKEGVEFFAKEERVDDE
jgi:hypothetical protein